MRLRTRPLATVHSECTSSTCGRAERPSKSRTMGVGSAARSGSDGFQARRAKGWPACGKDASAQRAAVAQGGGQSCASAHARRAPQTAWRALMCWARGSTPKPPSLGLPIRRSAATLAKRRPTCCPGATPESTRAAMVDVRPRSSWWGGMPPNSAWNRSWLTPYAAHARPRPMADTGRVASERRRCSTAATLAGQSMVG